MNKKFLEIQVNQSVDGVNENQTYKMIMSNQNISNHEDFSIEDDSDGEGEDSENGTFEQEQKDKFDNLIYENNIEPIEEEDGEESKYAPTPQKPVTSKMQNIRAVGLIKAVKAKEFEKTCNLEFNQKHNTKVRKHANQLSTKSADEVSTKSENHSSKKSSRGSLKDRGNSHTDQ